MRRAQVLIQTGILIVWLVLGAALGFLRSKATARNYLSDAVVYLGFSGNRSVDATGLGFLLTSDHLLEQAAKTRQLTRLFEYQDNPRLVDTLRRQVVVEPQQSNVGTYRVVVYTRTAEAAPLVLDALLQSAREELGALATNATSEYVDQLRRLVALLEKRAEEASADELRTEAADLPGDLYERVRYWERRAEQFRRELTQLQAMEQVAHTRNTEPKIPHTETTASPAEKTDQVERAVSGENAADVTQDSLRRRFVEPLIERDRQLAKQFGADHTQRKEIRRRLEIFNQILASPTLPPVDAIPLLVEEQILIEQYGAGHPRVQETRRKLQELVSSAVAHPQQDAGSAPSLNPADAAERGRPPGPPRVNDLTETDLSWTEQRQRKQSQLEFAELALKAARYDALLRKAEQQLDLIEQQMAAGSSRFQVLSDVSSAKRNWRQDGEYAAVGAGLGLLLAVVLHAIRRLVSPNPKT